MTWVAVGVAAVGTVTSIMSSSSAAKAQKRAAQRQAKLRDAQAKRMLAQNALNRFQTGLQGAEAQAQQLTSFASGGVDISSGSALQVLADTQAQVLSNQYLSLEEAKFNAQQMRNEGQALKSAAAANSSAVGMENAARLFKGAASAYGAYTGGGATST